jgi:hypothetical protein
LPLSLLSHKTSLVSAWAGGQRLDKKKAGILAIIGEKILADSAGM